MTNSKPILKAFTKRSATHDFEYLVYLKPIPCRCCGLINGYDKLLAGFQHKELAEEYAKNYNLRNGVCDVT